VARLNKRAMRSDFRSDQIHDHAGQTNPGAIASTIFIPAADRPLRRDVLRLCTAFLPAVPGLVFAQVPYPDRPVKVLIGFAPGGGADAVARIICTGLAEELGVPVVVENKPGANANIATEQVARAQADGLTLLYNTSSIAISPHLYARLGYDARRDLVPVALTAAIALVLVVSPRLGPRSVQELVSLLKSRPGALSYASSGTGNITHLAATELLRLSDSRATHVPYKSEAPAITDLLGGHVDFYIGNANTLIPQARENRLVPLAVTSLRRLPELPTVPTLAETLSPGLEMVAWSGFMAPAATPASTLGRLGTALDKVMHLPAVRSRIEQSGAEVRWADSAAYGRLVTDETARWGRAVQAAGLHPE
jgi:tripartite-type tricarboxylate transporter receptor subunit TctC